MQKIFISLSTGYDQSLLQEDLVSVNALSIELNIRLNSIKCSPLYFFEKDTLPEACYWVGKCTISDSKPYKDLGIWVTDSLAWSNHVNPIFSCAYTSLYVIKRNTPVKSSVVLKKRLCLTLVRSHLSYGCQLWHPILFKDIRNLEQVQQRATKFILHGYRSELQRQIDFTSFSSHVHVV